jgi:hypothetical protein
MRYVMTIPQGQLHGLVFGQTGFASASTFQEEYCRRIEVVRPSIVPAGTGDEDIPFVLSIELSQPKIHLADGTVAALRFSAVDDENPAINSENAWNNLSVEPLDLPDNSDSISYYGEINVQGLARIIGTRNQVRIGFDLVDANSGGVIRTLGGDRVFCRDSLHQLKMKESVMGLRGRRIYIRPRLVGFPKGDNRFTYVLVHVHRLFGDRQIKQQISPVIPEVVRHQELPMSFALRAAYPNPFNPSTEMRFEMPYSGLVDLAIYDLLGRRVATLVRADREPGSYQAVWNGTNDLGERVASGAYLVRFVVIDRLGEVQANKINRILLLK